MDVNKYSININSKHELESLCLPFIENGALFIETYQRHDIDDIIKLTINMPNKKKELSTKVVWVNPKAAQIELPEGIGLQFMNDTDLTTIEGYLNAN